METEVRAVLSRDGPALVGEGARGQDAFYRGCRHGGFRGFPEGHR